MLRWGIEEIEDWD